VDWTVPGLPGRHATVAVVELQEVGQPSRLSRWQEPEENLAFFSWGNLNAFTRLARGGRWDFTTTQFQMGPFTIAGTWGPLWLRLPSTCVRHAWSCSKFTLQAIHRLLGLRAEGELNWWYSSALSDVYSGEVAVVCHYILLRKKKNVRGMTHAW
jgi:hypothetical protein